MSDDRELLSKLLTHDLGEDEREAFSDMFQAILGGERRGLSEKQRAWAKRRLDELEPTYENLVSEGKVKRGKEVEMMFERGPLKPPGRS